MYLDPKRSQRFTKLFNTFIIRIAKRLGIASPDSVRLGELTNDEEYDTLEAIYGPDGSCTFIDEFISENPDRLDEADLRQVEDWGYGLFRNYFVSTEGDDIIYFHEGFEFAVTAPQDGSIDHNKDLKFALALVLPFDGVVTARTLGYSTLETGNGIFSEPASVGVAGNKNRHIVRTANEFMGIMKEVRAYEAAMDFDEVDTYEGDMDWDEFGTYTQDPIPTHRGKLAGLTPEERKKELARYREEQNERLAARFVSLYKEDLIGNTVKKAPKPSLRDYFMSMTKADLKDLLADAGLGYGLSKANKSQLVQALVDLSMQLTSPLAQNLAVHGLVHVNDVKRLVEAGGRLDIKLDDITKVNMVPESINPFILHYLHNNTLTAIIPSELYPILTSCDWEEILAHTKALNESLRYAMLLTQLRGVVSVEDIFEECFKRQGEAFDPQMLMDALDNPITRLYYPIYTDNPDSKNPDACYTIFEGVIELLGLAELNMNDYFASLMQILNAHSMLPPAPLTDELVSATSFEAWCRNGETGTKLAAFLDEHVPEGTSDYYFADSLVYDLIDVSRHDCGMLLLADILAEYGLILEGPDHDELYSLICDFFDTVPRWANNGWSDAEAFKLHRQSRPRFRLVD